MSNRWEKDLAHVKSWSVGVTERLRMPALNEQHAAWQREVLANIEDSKDLSSEIREHGVPFDVGDLANVGEPYPEIIPLLLVHLRKPHRRDVRGAILRALAVPYAGEEALKVLMQELKKTRSRLTSDELFEHGLAIAEVAYGSKNCDALFSVASDVENGVAREKPLIRLAQLKDHRAKELALERLKLHDSPWAAIHALYKLRAWDAADAVRPYVEDPEPNFRSEARKFLKRAAKG